ncbi:MAG: NAD(P)-dependent glycerol-3-phosphate dehydrogenase [Bacilli bacterium]|nr:NAD(P)-dependent glycerol-3-phosphate dehydrogenase [Bacilli bacterium]
MIFSVIGAGSWGTSLAEILAENNFDVTLYARSEQVCDEINNNHSNNKYFPFEIDLDKKVKATSNLNQAVSQADAIVLSVPSAQYRNVLTEIVKYLQHKVIIVSTAKGFDPETSERLSEVIKEIVPKEKIKASMSLIGPSHAEEVIQKLFTCVSVVGSDEKQLKIIQQAFSNNYFRVYTNTDEVGAEYAAALKNVIAIASGIMTGLGYGVNTRAALITRGLAEMTRFGMAMGGKMETYLGLSGLGDLMVTCTSKFSRNFQAGLKIGHDDSAQDFLIHNNKTVEGVKTARVMHDKALQAHIEMPITDAVYAVLFLDEKPSNVAKTLINRALKPEF